MSESDWRSAERAKETAEAYLKEQGVDIHVEMSESLGSNIMNRSAEVVAVAMVWRIADEILEYRDNGELESALELMYTLGRFESVANLHIAAPGLSVDQLIVEQPHLVFANALNIVALEKELRRKNATLKRKKQLAPDELLYKERDDTICRLFDEVKNQRGSPAGYAKKVMKEYNRIYYVKFPPFDPKKKLGDGSRCGRPLGKRQIKNILIKRGKIPKPEAKKI